MKNNFWSKLLLALIFGIFWFKGYTSLDLDFGQHLQTGKLILERGIPKTDPFSYTMPTWKYIDHAWLTDVLFWSLYSKVGIMGLAVVFAGLVLVVFGMLEKKYFFIPALLAVSVLLPRALVRPQVEDWLFFAVLLSFLNKWREWGWIVPVLFAVWVNLHGGYVAGLAAVMVFVIWRCWNEKKILVKDIGLGLLSLLATFINPYGTRIWEEVWLTVSDGNLHKVIAEWQPFYYGVDLGFWAMAIFTVGLGWRYKKKIKLWKWVIFGGLFVAGISSNRHMALFAVAAMPMLAEVLERMDEEFGKGEVGGRWKWFYKILVGVFAVLVTVQVGVGLINYKGLSEERFYPKKAAKWLRRQNYSGNLFSDYEWGGYLIWKYPEKKVFVDGRMPSWRRLGDWAFKDYLQVMQDGKYEDLFSKYDVEMVLWPKRDLWERKAIWNISWGKKKERFVLTKELEKKGWNKVYEDEVAIILFK